MTPRVRALRATLLLAGEAFAEALRRRIALALAAVAILALISVNRCTGAMTRGLLSFDGQVLDLERLGPVVGIPAFVMLALLVVAAAATLGSDALANPLEGGETTLWLARPVGRASYALARLGGALGLALSAELLLLGTSAGLLHVRQGLALGPPLVGALGCALGSLVVASSAMALSLALPRVATLLLMQFAIFLVVLANLAALWSAELTGWFGALAAYGPPLATVLVHALSPWSPGLSLQGSLGEAMLRLIAWAAGSVALLVALFRRAELQSGSSG